MPDRSDEVAWDVIDEESVQDGARRPDEFPRPKPRLPSSGGEKRCRRCRAKLSDHAAVTVRIDGRGGQVYICPQTSGHPVGEP
jgi:hypothetical protein